MKRTYFILLITTVGLLLWSCDGNPMQPDSLEEKPASANRSGSLTKITFIAQFDSSVPTGTIYGTVGDTGASSSSGGETLPSHKWTDNIYGSFYEVHIYANVKVNFIHWLTVTIDSPVNLEYLSPDSTWIGMLHGGTISALAVRTGSGGSGSLTLSDYSDYEEYDENGGD